MSPQPPDLRARARTELARVLVDLHDYTGMLAEHVIDDEADWRPGELTHDVRRIRLASLHVLTAVLRYERANGADWGALAEALGDRRGPDAVADHYNDTVTAWIESAAGDQDTSDVPDLPGLPAQVAPPRSRIPTQWRAARDWLAGWLAARRGAARVSAR